MKQLVKKGKKSVIKKKAVKKESKKEQPKEGQKIVSYQEQGVVLIPEKSEEKTPQPVPEKKEKFLLTEDFVKGVLVGAILTFIIVLGYVFLFLK